MTVFMIWKKHPGVYECGPSASCCVAATLSDEKEPVVFLIHPLLGPWKAFCPIKVGGGEKLHIYFLQAVFE